MIDLAVRKTQKTGLWDKPGPGELNREVSRLGDVRICEDPCQRRALMNEVIYLSHPQGLSFFMQGRYAYFA